MSSSASNTSRIGDALFTKTQQRVLGLLYGRPDRSFYLNELVRLAGVGKGSLRRELEKFCEAGLLTLTRQGNQNHYQANNASPIFGELKAITQKTFGIVDVLKDVLTPLLPYIDYAFVYGSIAKSSEHADSDIDLMLVGGELIYSDVMVLLDSAEQTLGRTINPTLYTHSEFTKRRNSNQHFVMRIMEQPKLWIIGDMEDVSQKTKGTV